LDLKPSLNDNEINQQTRMKNHTLWVLGLMCVSMVEWKFTGTDVFLGGMKRQGNTRSSIPKINKLMEVLRCQLGGEVSVEWKTKGGVSYICTYLKGGECIFPLI
jgi:hypothetical protein